MLCCTPQVPEYSFAEVTGTKGTQVRLNRECFVQLRRSFAARRWSRKANGVREMAALECRNRMSRNLT